MSNQIDNPKAPRLANFGRGVGELHSVTKQAAFRVAFRVDFGGQNLPKIDEISSLGALRFTSEFQAVKLMIFGGAQSWKSLILLRKNKVFRKIDFPPTGTIFSWFSRSKMFRNPLKFASKHYCFFDLVFEANFHDFQLQFGVPKLVKIQ